EAMKELAEPSFSAIPTSPVEKGKPWKWTSKLDMGPIGTYESNYTCTYTGEENKKHVIKMETEVIYKAANDMKTGLPFKIKSANIPTSKATGEILFDPEAGWVEKWHSTLTVKGDLTIEISNQTTKVDLDQTQETTITTSKDN